MSNTNSIQEDYFITLAHREALKQIDYVYRHGQKELSSLYSFVFQLTLLESMTPQSVDVPFDEVLI